MPSHPMQMPGPSSEQPSECKGYFAVCTRVMFLCKFHRLCRNGSNFFSVLPLNPLMPDNSGNCWWPQPSAYKFIKLCRRSLQWQMQTPPETAHRDSCRFENTLKIQNMQIWEG